ncbi:hypothetical protein FRC00_007540 [Tulasnella sp. 408]|nr:hypothetical protein FRC00_007540 [Tulasnella sp. 408]
MPADAGSTATQTNSSAGTGNATAGAITGGIIGGIGLLALIGALAWILIRRRRRKGDMDHPIGLFGPGAPPVGEADQHNLPAAVDYGAAYPHTPSPFTGSTSTMPKLYDPTDPTTFPPRTPVSFGYQSALPTGTDATPSNTLPSNPTHDHTVHSAGRYSGAPEL